MIIYNKRVNYDSLKLEYLDPNSLMYKKLYIVDKYVEKGSTFLDIGVGTGELIESQKYKFDKLYGIDIDKECVEFCRKRFERNENIIIISDSVNNIDKYLENEKFDCITCLDVLEHIDIKKCEKTLKIIYDHLRDNGKFIFSGPGIFEKIRILFGRSPTHIHSHSSYGWSKMFENVGFNIMRIESIEFPIIHSDLLRKKLHIFGKCCMIISYKISR